MNDPCLTNVLQRSGLPDACAGAAVMMVAAMPMIAVAVLIFML